MAITSCLSPLSTFLIFSSALLVLALAQNGTPNQSENRGILDIRQDTTCPGGGVCTLGNVCCGSGCMFSSGNCCGGDYFCYVGETCQGPNNVGDVDCCIDGSCTPAKFVIYYASGGSGSASATMPLSSTIASQTASSIEQFTTTSGQATATSQVQATSSGTTTGASSAALSPQTAATTSAAANPTTNSAPAAATTSKSAGAHLTLKSWGDKFVFGSAVLVSWPFLLLI